MRARSIGNLDTTAHLCGAANTAWLPGRLSAAPPTLCRSMTSLNFPPPCGRFIGEVIIVFENKGRELMLRDNAYRNRPENGDFPQFSAARWRVFEGSHELLFENQNGLHRSATAVRYRNHGL